MFAEKSYETFTKRAPLARSFVAGEYDWHVIVTEMSGFMSDVSTTVV